MDRWKEGCLGTIMMTVVGLFILNCAKSRNLCNCTGVDCSDHGHCQILNNGPTCVCDPGYHVEGLTCVQNSTENPCEGVTCSGHGQCVILDGSPACRCASGYHPENLSCVPDSIEDPCEGVSCSGHGVCAVLAGSPVCICDPGFSPDGLDCVEEDTRCCIPEPDTFKVLGEGLLNLANRKSDPIPVGSHREVVVFLYQQAWSSPGCSGACCPTPYRAYFRPSSSASFGYTGQDISSGARLRVDGTDLQVALSDGAYPNCDQVEYRYVVAGVQAGQGCCQQGPDSFDLLGQGRLNLAERRSNPISVGSYQEIVVYMDNLIWNSPGCSGACCPRPAPAYFRADSSASFGKTGQDISSGARLRVDGADLQVTLNDGSYSNCDAVEYQFAVVGVRPGSECCLREPKTFEVLSQGSLDLASRKSNPIPVGSYREVVVYIEPLAWSSPGCAGSCCPIPGSALFRADSSFPFGGTGQSISSGARLRVDGADLQVALKEGTYANCAEVEYGYVVAGLTP